MSDEVITFELKQSQAESVNGNGDYSVVVQKAITLNEGDTLSLDKVFVDTAAQTESTINVEDDMNLTFTFTHWITGLFTDNRTYNNITPGPGATVAPSARKFIPCILTSGEILPAGFIEIRFLRFFRVPSQGSFFFGGFPVKFSYIDLNNTVQTFSSSCPLRYFDSTKPISDVNGQIVIPVGVIAKSGSERQIEPAGQPAPVHRTFLTWKETEDIFFTTNTIIISTQDGTNIFTPVTKSTTITIPRGNYNPAVMADLLTTKMTANRIQKSSNDGILDNTLLFTSDNYVTDKATGKDIFFTPAERDNQGTLPATFFKFTTAQPPVFVGTNQFAIEYDGISHFVIKDMHMPMYIDGNKVVLYTRIEDALQIPSVLPILSYSGIILNDVTSTYATLDKKVNFWRDNCGFDMGVLNPQTKLGFVNFDVEQPLNNLESLVPVFDFQQGVNITEGLNSIDNVVSKGNSTAQASDNSFTFATVPDQTAVIIGDATSSIISNNIFESNRIGGYYKIKIDCGVSNYMEGEDNIERNVFGVLSKYYESNSFASAGAEASIPYIHRGLPIQLSQFRVQILNSENLEPFEISEDNTVFMRLTRGQKAIAPAPAPAPAPAK